MLYSFVKMGGGEVAAVGNKLRIVLMIINNIFLVSVIIFLWKNFALTKTFLNKNISTLYYTIIRELKITIEFVIKFLFASRPLLVLFFKLKYDSLGKILKTSKIIMTRGVRYNSGNVDFLNYWLPNNCYHESEV